MWVLGKALVTIAVLHTCIHAVDIRTFTKDWSTPRRNSSFKISEDVSRSDNKFVYAICDDAQLPVESECDVKIETMSESSSVDDTKVCHFKFTPNDEHDLNKITGAILTLRLLGQDKVLTTNIEHDRKNDDNGYLRINVLDMNKCTEKQVTFSYDDGDDVISTEVVVYGNIFDVITKSKKACNDGDFCRLTFDEEGTQIAGPTPFHVNLTAFEVLPIEESSSQKGFYVSGFSVNADRMFITRFVDNNKIRLMKVENYHPFTTHIVTSNKHSNYGICWSKGFGENEVHCAQFVVGTGEARLNVTLTFDEEVTPMVAHNIPDGMLVVTMTSKCDNFELTKILSNGHIGSVKVDEVNLDCSLGPFIVTAGVVDTENEYCFNFVNEEKPIKDEKFVERSMQYRTKCISKHDVDVL